MRFNLYLEYVNKNLNSVKEKEIEELINIIFQAYMDGRMIFIIGNGGSASNASHLAQDLSKGTKSFTEQVKRIKAISLTDNTSFITALGNDEGYEEIFVQQLKTFANAGDILIAISGSGKSPNIIKAVEWANNNNLLTVGVTGFDGGILHKINQRSLHVPLDDMCTVESLHSVIFHYIALELQEKVKKDQLQLIS